MDFFDRLKYPIVQAGMGVRVSSYNLARTSSSLGGLGVVSSVGLDTILIRELQQGDPTGELATVLQEFPDQEFVEELFDTYYINGGKDPDARYKLRKVLKGFNQEGNELSLDTHVQKLIIAGTYAEVKRAKIGHDNPVGINFMYKIRWPLLEGLYGAMLAGADAVFVGAGFPQQLSKRLQELSEGKKTLLPAEVANSSKEWFHSFTPMYGSTPLSEYVAIISNHLGAKAVPDAKGYVIESPNAGGHNPPARSKQIIDGEPVYTEKDMNNINMLNSMLEKNSEKNGFKQEWIMAGGCYDKLDEAISLGARGIQVGSVMAITQESGIIEPLKKEILQYIMNGGIVKTDAYISPTGFPFKVLLIP